VLSSVLAWDGNWCRCEVPSLALDTLRRFGSFGLDGVEHGLVAGGELVDTLFLELFADLFLVDANPDQVRPQPAEPGLGPQ
jgi:hypothetical protein